MEYEAKKTGLKVSYYHFPHTKAQEMLSVDTELVMIHDLLGHSRITTTHQYYRVSNRKFEVHCYKAMEGSCKGKLAINFLLDIFFQ